MSSNAFMLPVLPQTPDPGLNGTDTSVPATFKSNRLEESSGRSKSFSATLNRISDRRYDSKPETTPADQPVVRSRDSNTDSPTSNKMSKTTGLHRHHIEQDEAPVFNETSPSIHSLHVFGLMHPHLKHISLAEDGFLAVESRSGSTSESSLSKLADLIGRLQPQEGQQMESGQLSIGPFEQLQAIMSPAVESPSGSTSESSLSKLTDLIGHLQPQGQQMESGQLSIGPFEQLQAIMSPAVESPSGSTSESSLSKLADLIGHLQPQGQQMESGQLSIGPFEQLQAIMSPAVESPSGSTSESSLSKLADLIGHLQPQGQQMESGQLSIGPFEQLQVIISPEATNRAFFEQLVGRAIHYQDNGELMGNPAQDGILNGQTESLGANGNTLFNPLLQMLGISGGAWGLTPDAGSSGEPKMAAGLDLTSINEALLVKMPMSSQPAETGISENAEGTGAGQNDRLSFWASGDSNLETLLEAQARKIQAALKAAAEQPANPNSATQAIGAKTPEEIFGIKSPVLKSEMLPVHALGDKINQIDADSKDSGFLFSQDQTPQHLTRLENTAQPSEAAQRSLMSQTLNQIVQKAVLSLHNGQHEVQLHLKPEFLGDIRMQIVSEGQQVTIKIVAELPFVKDMLENNLHQLKAELQAQGLNIDELEVSVAHDSHAEGELQQNAEAARLQALKNGSDSADGSSENPDQAPSRGGDPMAETAIDYFA